MNRRDGMGRRVRALARRRLLLVRYAELESLWMGETPKNVAAIFRAARDERAVLLFDEADAIAARRSTSVDHGFQRESNTVISVLLQELERYNGVVIFATNLAANFDPAFERRIRTHVLFEMPGEAERAQIWRVQLHPARTPLATDVDFQALDPEVHREKPDARSASVFDRIPREAGCPCSRPNGDLKSETTEAVAVLTERPRTLSSRRETLSIRAIPLAKGRRQRPTPRR
jgi:SpoVK/Ycf46/Vps4 family AAA+-type ATPase